MASRPVRAEVRVPATSANLGAGFDACGLALTLYDEVVAEVLDAAAGAAGSIEIDVTGEGADTVPRDGDHLIVRTMAAVFADAGAALPPLRLSCHNRIPHGRGLGSSAAAIVAGVLLGRGLLPTSGGGPAAADSAQVLATAAAIEGHPDNVAACVLGGYTVAWTEPDGTARALSRPVHRSVTPVLFVPGDSLSTERARGLLPDLVPFGQATFNIARAALLSGAITTAPDLLWTATDDRLHQAAREPAYPASVGLVRLLRAAGIAAAVSGAGPTVLALAVGTGQVQQALAIPAAGFVATPLAVEPSGATLEVVTGS